MRRWRTAICIIAALSTSAALAQSSGRATGEPAEKALYEEDISWSQGSPQSFTMVATNSFGERVAHKLVQPPDSALKLAEEIRALTPQEGLKRLAALGELERMLTRDRGPEERAAELEALADLTEEIDAGDRAFTQAFYNYVRAMDSDKYLYESESYSLRVRQAIGCIYPLKGGSLFESHLSGEPCDWYESCGEAFIESVEEGLKDIERFDWSSRDSLLSLNYCGMLGESEINRLLRAAAPSLAMLTTPSDPEEGRRLEYIGETFLPVLGGLPELAREDARTLLSLLCGMKSSRIEHASSFRDARRLLMHRYDLNALYPEGIPPSVENCRADDMKRTWSSNPDPPRHVRVSTWRFAPGVAPECLATRSFETEPGVWTIRSWGEPRPYGVVAVLQELDDLRWRTLIAGMHSSSYNDWEEAGYVNGSDVSNGAERCLMEQCMSLPAADGWREIFDRGTISASIIEIDKKAMGDRLDSGQLYDVLTMDLEGDYRFRAAALGYLKSRSDPAARETLKALCQREMSDHEIRVEVARVLLENRDYAAFDEMAPNILKRQPWRYPPLLNVFEAAADPDLAPEAKRLGWAKTIISTRITPPMHPDNVEILLKLCGKLGAPDFQYSAKDGEEQRSAALGRARAWAE